MADPSAIPQCGMNCILEYLSYSSCAATDTACFCADQVYGDLVANCVLSNCTIREGLVVKNATSNACGLPEPNQDATLLALEVVLFGLQTMFFILRMLNRAVRMAPWGMDDTTITIAFVAISGFLGAGILEQRNGLGRNVWTLTPDQITKFIQLFFVFEVLYSFALAMVKISICFLYLRLFPNRRFRNFVWATQVFNTVFLVISVIVDLNQCHPLSHFWNGWDGEDQGHCINLNAYAWVHAVINIVLDFWMLALPATQVWNLDITRKKKLCIMTMFGFGIFLTAVSIIRLQSLLTFDKTLNPTSDFFGVSIWSVIEITAGLMVACMPAARIFVMYYIPGAITGKLSRLTEPYRVEASGDTGPSGRSLSSESVAEAGRSSYGSKKPPMSIDAHPTQPLTAPDLDKNRAYSMRATVTSTGKFSTSSEASPTGSNPDYNRKDSEIELTSFDNFPEPPCSPASRTGEYLGVPDGLLTDSPPSPSQIWVRQDVSVKRSPEVGDSTAEAGEGRDEKDEDDEV